MREVGEKVHHGQPEQFPVRTKQGQGAHWVRVLPIEPRLAAVHRKRFRQNQQPVESVEQTEDPGHPERQARIDGAKPASDGRPEYEPDAERRAKNAKGVRALFRRRDVADVSVHGRDTR